MPQISKKKSLTFKQKLRRIEDMQDKIDFMLLESLASCAIEGNPMYNRVGYVLGYIMGVKEQPPTEVMVDSVLRLLEGIK